MPRSYSPDYSPRATSRRGRHSRSRSRSRGRGRRDSRNRSPDRRYGGGRRDRGYGGGRRDDRGYGGGRRDRDRGYGGGNRNYGGGRRDRNYGGGRRGGHRRGRRGRSYSPDVDPLHQPLDKFRHPSISLSPPTDNTKTESYKMNLEQEEIAYVFGRMGSTKDKLGRVSGTHIELRGAGLLIEGIAERIEKAKRYVRILLAQRHGIVDIDPEDHEDDLTLMQIPTDCKGFVTGRNGATLRQIERESATLMTFCRTEADNEPLAIFGTRRGRLYAQLKIMSIVEGKHENWFCKKDGNHPVVDISKIDTEDDDWGVTWFKLAADMVGYALGRGGETRMKLEIASGCIIQYIGYWASFAGRKKEQERGNTYLNWLLEQQNSNVVKVAADRDDLKYLWVPESSVGYVTGIKAKTLRNLESKTGTFCFFDKSNMGREMEEMLIFSWNEAHREAAAEEVHLIVDFHQRKTGGNERATDVAPTSKGRKGGRDSRSRSRGSKDSRSRSYSRSKSRGSRSRSYSRSKSGGSRSRSKGRSKSRSVKREN